MICLLLLAKDPEIANQPISQTVDLAQRAEFSCSATSEVKYQWKKASGELPSKVTGINTKTLVIPDVRLADQSTYTCVISNAFRSIESNPVDLTVEGMYVCKYKWTCKQYFLI